MSINRLFASVVVTAAMFAGGHAIAASLPPTATCLGRCGTDGADGVVRLSPLANPSYLYLTTRGGVRGAGEIAGIGGADGSELITQTFTVTAGADLQLYFDFITSDGGAFSDYAFGEILDASDHVAATLFTARTEPTGAISPGSGLPANDATLTPPATTIIPGGPVWSPLGPYSGQCYAAGCGETGWIRADYAIPTAGTYALEFGVTNYIDPLYDSGLAIDGVMIGGPTPAPEPATLATLGLAVAALLVVRRRAPSPDVRARAAGFAVPPPPRLR